MRSRRLVSCILASHLIALHQLALHQLRYISTRWRSRRCRSLTRGRLCKATSKLIDIVVRLSRTDLCSVGEGAWFKSSCTLILQSSSRDRRIHQGDIWSGKDGCVWQELSADSSDQARYVDQPHSKGICQFAKVYRTGSDTLLYVSNRDDSTP